MPGKPDAGYPGDTENDPIPGQYFPGSKEYRAWDRGWRERYAGQPNDPDPLFTPAEQLAYSYGYNAADTNTAGARRMPATTGTPPP